MLGGPRVSKDRPGCARSPLVPGGDTRLMPSAKSGPRARLQRSILDGVKAEVAVIADEVKLAVSGVGRA